MKNLIVVICLAIAFMLAAVDFNTSFNACLLDGNLRAADSILNVWSRESPDDPELFPARFNLMLNSARSEISVHAGEPAQNSEALAFSDSTGKIAGYISGEVTWQDSLVDESIREIDRGIAAYPDRIDFYLGKAAAASMTGRWNLVAETLDNLLEREKVNGGQWLTTGNEIETNADTILAEAIFARFRDIYNSESAAAAEAILPFVDKAAQRFAKDTRIINLAGAINFGLDRKDAAMKYFLEAANLTPDDAIPLNNIGYIQQGDTAKALEIYHKVADGNFDEADRSVAKEMIDEITKPIKDMEEYPYFFGYLPKIAEMVDNSADFMDIEMINSSIPAYYKLRSPFADTDIKAEEVTVKTDDNDVKTVVWTFPMPEKMPMCLYVAFVADEKGVYHIYTLEKSINNCWVVGTQNGTTHANFGDIPLPANAEAFVKALADKGILQQQKSNASKAVSITTTPSRSR